MGLLETSNSNETDPPIVQASTCHMSAYLTWILRCSSPSNNRNTCVLGSILMRLSSLSTPSANLQVNITGGGEHIVNFELTSRQAHHVLDGLCLVNNTTSLALNDIHCRPSFHSMVTVQSALSRCNQTMQLFTIALAPIDSYLFHVETSTSQPSERRESTPSRCV